MQSANLVALNVFAGQVMFPVYFQIPGRLQMAWRCVPSLRAEKEEEEGKKDESFVFEVVCG